MLEELFHEVYAKFKLHFYLGIFDQVHERIGSLSAMEAFSVEIIYALREPTIGEFAECIGISQPNATYKVNSLIKKGYIEKLNSDEDKREYHLKVTQKFFDYCNINNDYIKQVMQRIRARFTQEEVKQFEHILEVMSHELMPENAQIIARY